MAALIRRGRFFAKVAAVRAPVLIVQVKIFWTAVRPPVPPVRATTATRQGW